MLREIFSALSSKSSIDAAFTELTDMLEHAAWMFERADEVLHSRVPAEDVHDAIYDRDRAINELERSIRRKILRHLVINPGHDVAVCLALMSVAKDAERIGDYCKNVYELGRVYTQGFHVAKYQAPLDRYAEMTLALFERVAAASRDSDESLARQAMKQSLEIRRGCDRIINDLFREEQEVEFHEAVAYSLLARHYKRVAGHLANIATGVLGNLEDLDFEPETDLED
jgi:phosphate transport system protein